MSMPFVPFASQMMPKSPTAINQSQFTPPTTYLRNYRLNLHALNVKVQSLDDRLNELKAKAEQLRLEQEQVETEMQRLINEDYNALPDPEDIARMIEEGGSLPPEPPGGWAREPEPAEEFKARIQASIAHFERLVQGKKYHPPPDSTLPLLEDDADEIDWEKREPLGELPDEITKPTPAPDLPFHVFPIYKAAERIMYVLRRAHLTNTPSAAVKMLTEKELVDEEGVQFEDPWVELVGRKDWESYMGKVESAGVEWELYKVWAELYSYRPVPQFQVIADVYMHFPLPLSYMKFLLLHSVQPSQALFKDADLSPGSSTSKEPSYPIVKDAGYEDIKKESRERDMRGFQPNGATLYPKEQRQESVEEGLGTAYLKWLKQQPTTSFADKTTKAYCIADKILVCVSRGGKYIEKQDQEEESLGDEGAEVECEFVVGRFARFDPIDEEIMAQYQQQAPPSSSNALPDYNLLPIASILEENWGFRSSLTSATNEEQQQKEDKAGNEKTALSVLTGAIPPPAQPCMPRKKVMEDGEISPEEAEQALRNIFGDKFDDLMKKLPKPGKGQKRREPSGNKWQKEPIFTVALTLCYSINSESGKVDTLTATWGEIAGVLTDVRDAYDIYMKETGVLNWSFGEDNVADF